MAEIVPLREAVAELVRDGDAVALEGFTHLIPFAAGHELIRQGRSELELIRMTPDILYDQLIGVGACRRLVFSYGGNPGVGSLHRFRDAIENGWPRAIEIEEHSHAGMANRYAAGAAHLPCGLLRGYRGTDLVAHTRVAFIQCPFTGEELAAFGDGLDLLVVGSRSYGPVRRLVSGSTSDFLQRHARCSLLVLVRESEAGPVAHAAA